MLLLLSFIDWYNFAITNVLPETVQLCLLS